MNYQQRVEEAVETLDRYIIHPFWSDFLERQQPKIPLAPRGILKDLVSSLLHGTYSGVQGYKIELTELERYLEQLQLHGRQHVFLFSLREEQLERLRNPDTVKLLLAERADLFNAHADVWPSSERPELAAVTHDAERDLLLLEWIEIRTWMKITGKQVDKNGKQIIIKTPQLERTANYFHVDLATGDADLRLEKLHGNAKQARLELRKTYSELVGDTLALELPEPIVLAPAIRYALIENLVEPDSWGTVLPDGGQWYASRGDRCPVALQQLRAVISLKYSARPQKGGTAHVLVDGQIDEVQIQNPMVPREHARILETVRSWHRRSIAQADVPVPFPSPGEGPDGDTGEPIVPEAPEGLWKRLRRTHQQASTSRALKEEHPPPSRIDAAAVEYLASHRDRKKAGSRLASPYSIEQFVTYVDEIARGDKREHDERVDQIGKDERWLYRLSYLSTALMLVLITGGGLVVFFTEGHDTIGALGQLIGLASGGATAMLRWNGRALRTSRLDIERQWNSRRGIQDYVHLVITIGDPEKRARELEKAALMLHDRAKSFLEAA